MPRPLWSDRSGPFWNGTGEEGIKSTLGPGFDLGRTFRAMTSLMRPRLLFCDKNFAEGACRLMAFEAQTPFSTLPVGIQIIDKNGMPQGSRLLWMKELT